MPDCRINSAMSCALPAMKCMSTGCHETAMHMHITSLARHTWCASAKHSCHHSCNSSIVCSRCISLNMPYAQATCATTQHTTHAVTIMHDAANEQLLSIKAQCVQQHSSNNSIANSVRRGQDLHTHLPAQLSSSKSHAQGRSPSACTAAKLRSTPPSRNDGRTLLLLHSLKKWRTNVHSAIMDDPQDGLTAAEHPAADTGFKRCPA
jgi:hypothetical protein